MKGQFLEPPLINLFILICRILLFGKSFETQETVSVKAAKETILEIPYNQNTTIQFPEIVRTIWTSVSSNDMRVIKDKNFIQVSARAESPVTVILADGSVYPVRLIPLKTVKTFAFNIQDIITKEIGRKETFENKSDLLKQGDLLLMTDQEISMIHELYEAYFQYLEGNDNIVGEYQIEIVNKTISEIKTVNIVECLIMNSGQYSGIVYELKNEGPSIEIKDDDLIPFLISYSRMEGYSSINEFFIDSYTIPQGRKTGLFTIYQK